jgi:type III restriction enzyme
LNDLKERFKDIYLLRNERFFKLYRFSDAKATEPDFVLYMKDKNSEDEVVYQLFIEPKGDHLLYNDEWKEQFLKEIEKEAVIELYENQQYKLIGMPFYNKANREDVFAEKLNGF